MSRQLSRQAALANKCNQLEFKPACFQLATNPDHYGWQLLVAAAVATSYGQQLHACLDTPEVEMPRCSRIHGEVLHASCVVCCTMHGAGRQRHLCTYQCAMPCPAVHVLPAACSVQNAAWLVLICIRELC